VELLDLESASDYTPSPPPSVSDSDLTEEDTAGYYEVEEEPAHPKPDGCHLKAWRHAWWDGYRSLPDDAFSRSSRRQAEARETLDSFRKRLGKVTCACRPHALWIAKHFLPLTVLSDDDIVLITDEGVGHDLETLETLNDAVCVAEGEAGCVGRQIYWPA
jgi:hypothetical protein